MIPRLLALLPPVSVYALASWPLWFVCDDAYISFRYARNWATGVGLRYNPGESPPVEGYSNFGWMAAAALCEALGLAPAEVLPAVSWCCGAVLVAAVGWIARERLQASWPVASVAALAVAASPPVLVWATGGLETMATALALLLLVDAWVLSERPRATSWGVAAALAVALLRTEGIAWVAVAAVLGVLVRAREPGRGGDDRRALLRAVAVAALLYGAYFAARAAWFGTLLSNTASAKVGFGADRLERGARYVGGLWLDALSPAVPVLLAPVAAWFGGARGAAVAALTLAGPAYAVLVGGDFMAMGRLLVPTLAFGGLVLAVVVQRASAHLPRGAVGVALVVPLLSVQSLAERHWVPLEARAAMRVRFNTNTMRSELEQWAFMKQNTRSFLLLGAGLRQAAEPGDSVVLGAIGAIGYASGLVVHDRYGLVSPSVLDAPHHDVRGTPGHDKLVPGTFFLPQEPDWLWVDYLRKRGSLQVGVDRLRQRGRRGPSGYGPSITPVEVDGKPWFLLGLRRMEDAEEAWERLPERVAELKAAAAAPR